MWPYIICFIISSYLIYISNNVKNKFSKKIMIFIALIIPCVLASLRSLTIGTDVQVYLNPMCMQAQLAENFENYLSLRVSPSRFVYKYEIGFTALVYIFSKSFKNIHVVMFVIETLIIFPIYFGCKKNKYLKDKLWLCMFVYYCLFFNYGLNTMREFIGLSFAFLALSSYISGERSGLKKYILFSLIAFLFHKSSILSLFILIIFKIQNNRNDKQLYLSYNSKKLSVNKLISIIIIALSLYFLFNMKLFNSLLYSIDGFTRYTNYYSGNVIFSINNLIKILPILLIFLVLHRNFTNKFDKSMFYTTIFCFAWLIFVNLSTASSYGDRISNIFKLMSIIIYPMLTLSPEEKKQKFITQCLIISYVLFYFWYMYVFKGYHETVPFIFG